MKAENMAAEFNRAASIIFVVSDVTTSIWNDDK